MGQAGLTAGGGWGFWKDKEAGYLLETQVSSLVPFYDKPLYLDYWSDRVLALSDSEHLGAAYGANALSRRFTILHGNGFRVFHIPFGPAFNTISLHYSHLLSHE